MTVLTGLIVDVQLRRIMSVKNPLIQTGARYITALAQSEYSMDYDMKRFMDKAKEMFQYNLMAYKDKDKSYRHPEDINPKDFVPCLPVNELIPWKEIKKRYK